MGSRADEKKTDRGGIGGDDSWTIGLTDFLPPGPKFPRSTTLNLGEMFTQLGFVLPNAGTNEGGGTDGRPPGLPFASDLLRLLSLHGVLVFPLGQVQLVLCLPFIVSIARNRLRRRV